MSKVPHGVRRLLRLPRSRARLLREMDDEVGAHFAMRIDELRALGMSETDAQAEALRRFGDSDEYRAYVARRVARQARWGALAERLDEATQDVRFANRQFTRNAGLSVVAVLTLALGIGANTAIFSVVHRLLLDPLPFPNGDRIVLPMQDLGAAPQSTTGAAAVGVRPIDGALVDAWKERATSYDMIASAWDVTFGVRDDGTVEHVPNGGMTPNFLRTLGVQPALGRGFTDEEATAKNPGVTMISYGRWQRDFAGSPDAVGSTLEFEGTKYTIVGVTPRGLLVPYSSKPTPEIWMPAQLSNGSYVIATLRPGVSTDAATRELQAIAEAVHEKGRVHTGLRVMRPRDFLDSRTTRSVEVLFVAVGALLLIACANVANLLLARAWTRRREFAVRAALGAARGRLTRQVLTESVLLALVGGLLGVGVAWGTLRVIIALRPPTLTQLDGVRIEPAVLLWSLGVSIATGILFGCLPAIFAGARPSSDVLRNESRTGTAGVASRRVRSVLIVFEIAMSLVLLVGAGLLVRSFAELQHMRLGFEPRGLAQVTVITGPHNRGREALVRQAIIDRLRAIPGVTGVAIGTMPGQGFGGGGLESEPDATGHAVRAPIVGTNPISPDYFRVARIALVEGGLPDSLAAAPAGPALFSSTAGVVLNRALARRLWPNGNAIGSRVRPARDGPVPPGFPAEPWSTVVGIADDIQLPGMRGDFHMMNHYALLNSRFSNIPFLVRTSGSGEQLMGAVEKAVKADPTVLFYGSQSGEAYLRESLAPTQFAMALLTAFAILALVLAAVGLYGVIAYGVTQRTREIGVRVALGADPRAVTRLVVGGGMRLAAVGVAIGAVTAAATTRLLESMLYAVTPTDPVTFSLIALLVATIAILASYVPARRALRIDPTEALRAD
jgi:predicted permease